MPSGAAGESLPARMEISTRAGPCAGRARPARRAATFLLVMTHGAGGGVIQQGSAGGARRGRPPRRGGGPCAAAVPGAGARGHRARRPAGRGVAGDRRGAAGRSTRPAAGAGRPQQWRAGGVPDGRRQRARAAVVALAFPLHPPGRPEQSRVAELRGQARTCWWSTASGTRSGSRHERDAARVVVLPGETHTLTQEPGRGRRGGRAWLAGADGGGAERRASRAAGAPAESAGPGGLRRPSSGS